MHLKVYIVELDLPLIIMWIIRFHDGSIFMQFVGTLFMNTGINILRELIV